MTIREMQQEILRLKKENDICILAHSYQRREITEAADFIGDSYALAKRAQNVPNKTVIMCGVRFMAETVKILSPEKTVVLANSDAGCPMAEQMDKALVEQLKAAYPGYTVAAYINTTAELKTVCDVCVTSSSAVKILSAMPEKDILFIPDINLGSYIQKQLPEKNIVLWNGYCPVHNAVTVDECKAAVALHPHAKVLMHPELPAEVLQFADVIGSTADIIRYALESEDDCIVGTENTVRNYLAAKRPDKHFYLLSKGLICPDMRMTTLTDVYHAMLEQSGQEIRLEEELRLKAKHAIDEMIRLGR